MGGIYTALHFEQKQELFKSGREKHARESANMTAETIEFTVILQPSERAYIDNCKM